MLIKEATAERTDPRTRRTRQLLFDAFGQLLSEQSFDAITVQDISERATVNRATFYAHFEDKYILLDQYMAEMVQQAFTQKLPPESRLSREDVRRLIQTVCEFLDVLRTHCSPSQQNQFETLVERQVKAQVYSILLNWLAGSHLHADAAPEQLELVATVTSWGIYGAAQSWQTVENRIPSADFARQALPLILAGLDSPTSSRAQPANTFVRG